MPATLARWDPFFDRLFAELVPGREREWTPAIDVVREDGNLVLRADIPGIKPDEVKIEVADDVLTVSGEHSESKEEKAKDYVRRERRYGSFMRSMPLPAGVDPRAIAAKTHDGVLEVTIPLPAEGGRETITITPTSE